jgi:two-component SAPR family response regulator
VFIADNDPENIRALIRLFRKNYMISPETWKNRRGFSDFLQSTEDGAVFVRIDDPSVGGLKLSSEALKFNSGIQLVWMAASGAYALDAFPRGVDAYLLLPAKEETLDEVMKSLNIVKSKQNKNYYIGGKS